MASEYTNSFNNFQTMRNFGKDIYNDEITLKEADDDQNNLLVEIIDFKNKKITRSREKIRKKI